LPRRSFLFVTLLEYQLINQVKVFLDWPKWHCHCKVHCNKTESTGLKSLQLSPESDITQTRLKGLNFISLAHNTPARTAGTLTPCIWNLAVHR